MAYKARAAGERGMMLFVSLFTATVLGQATKNATAAPALDMGTDCRAPTIFNACMDRGQQMLEKCAGDAVCKCRFSRALSLCFEQCKTANPAQKQQIDAGSEAACAKLTAEQKSAAFTPVSATPSATSAFPTGTTGIAAKVNAKGTQNGTIPAESSSGASVATLSPLLLACVAYAAL